MCFHAIRLHLTAKFHLQFIDPGSSPCTILSDNSPVFFDNSAALPYSMSGYRADIRRGTVGGRSGVNFGSISLFFCETTRNGTSLHFIVGFVLTRSESAFSAGSALASFEFAFLADPEVTI